MKQQSGTARKRATPVVVHRVPACLQRQCACGQHATAGECDACRQRRASVNRHASRQSEPDDWGSAGARDAGLHEVLRSPGQPLDPDTRSLMESRFDHDFSAVRVHTDARAAESSRLIGANAWAFSNHLVFASGRYAPQTASGRHLLAHELTHVIQQRHAPAVHAQTDLEVSDPADAAEREAEAVSDRVVAGQTASVQARAGEATVHRDIGEALKGVGIGLGIGAGIGLLGLGIAWLAGAFDSGPKKATGQDDDASGIEKPPTCGERQLKKLRPALATAIGWVTTALGRLRAFIANPGGPDNAYVKQRLAAKDRFSSDTPETAAIVNRVIAQIQRLIGSKHFVYECHTGKDDSLCSLASAYVNREEQKVVLCGNYFKPDRATARALVHEFAHAVTGGAPITDRAYQGERILPRLSTDEALTNAENFAEFIQDLAENRPFAGVTPEDRITCAEASKGVVSDALAKAERWNTNAWNVAADAGNRNQMITWRNQFLPAAASPNPDPAAEIAAVAKIYEKTHTALYQPVDIVCDPPAVNCPAAGPLVTFQPGDRKLHVCSAWTGQSEDDRIVGVLSALYGPLGGEARAGWQIGLAKIAQTITKVAFAPPTHAEIAGNPAWTADLLSIAFNVRTRIPRAKPLYTETLRAHTRLSNDLPAYEGPPCNTSILPFSFAGTFHVDSGGIRRPGPFAPPALSLTWSFDGEAGKEPANSGHLEDANPQYQGEGSALKTPLHDPVNLSFQHNGVFGVSIRMQDPETNTTLAYDDRIQVHPDIPCPGQKPGAAHA